MLAAYYSSLEGALGMLNTYCCLEFLLFRTTFFCGAVCRDRDGRGHACCDIVVHATSNASGMRMQAEADASAMHMLECICV